MKPVYAKLSDEGAKIPDNVFFMKQKISNACGTFALFHALTQNEKNLDFGLYFLQYLKIAFDV